MNKLFPVVIVLMALFIGASSEAATKRYARGAICDSRSRITALKYYSSGSFHGAMDQAVRATTKCWTRDSSSARYHRGSINSSRYYRYLGGCGATCRYNIGNRCNGGAGNMISTVGSGGWDWRQMHINHLSGHSRSKTCKRCSFGLVGSTGNSSAGHAHVENRRYGSKMTGWMSGRYVGESSPCTKTVGRPYL